MCKKKKKKIHHNIRAKDLQKGQSLQDRKADEREEEVHVGSR